MSRIHAIMNGTAPLNSLQMEKGHLLANSPSAASLSRRLSQVCVMGANGQPNQVVSMSTPDLRVERTQAWIDELTCCIEARQAQFHSSQGLHCDWYYPVCIPGIRMHLHTCSKLLRSRLIKLLLGSGACFYTVIGQSESPRCAVGFGRPKLAVPSSVPLTFSCLGAQGGASMSSADGSLSRLNSGLNSGRPSSSSGGAITPYKPKWDPGVSQTRMPILVMSATSDWYLAPTCLRQSKAWPQSTFSLPPSIDRHAVVQTLCNTVRS